MEKVNKLIKAELAPVLEMYTKELGGLVTITYVKTSPDLAQAYVGISCFQTGEEAANVISVLNQHAILFHKDISRRLHLRKVPKLSFRMDESGAYAAHIEELFIQIKQEKDTLK